MLSSFCRHNFSSTVEHTFRVTFPSSVAALNICRSSQRDSCSARVSCHQNNESPLPHLHVAHPFCQNTPDQTPPTHLSVRHFVQQIAQENYLFFIRPQIVSIFSCCDHVENEQVRWGFLLLFFPIRHCSSLNNFPLVSGRNFPFKFACQPLEVVLKPIVQNSLVLEFSSVRFQAQHRAKVGARTKDVRFVLPREVICREPRQKVKVVKFAWKL